jgi:hypothetical protein
MADRSNQTMIEWLDINLDQLSSDDRMRLCEEVFDSLSAQEGYPLKAGHHTPSTTSRHALMALPRSGQVLDMR